MYKYTVGLDLGQTTDPTALCIVERSKGADPPSGAMAYDLDVVYLRRYALLTPYPQIVRSICDLLRSPELQPNPVLVVDATGVGRAVVDLFLNADINALVLPLTITSGQGAARGALWNETGFRAFWVPKIDLVSTIQAALGHGRLKVVPKLELADLLRRELLNFKMKMTSSGNETYGAWRESDHDDLVLSVAMAAWLAENWHGPPAAPVGGEVVTNHAVHFDRDARIWGQLGTNPYADSWHRR